MNRGRQNKNPFHTRRLFLLAIFFLFGILFGQVVAFGISDIASEEIKEYLFSYLQIEDKKISMPAIFSLALLYIRYPLLAILMSFTSVGSLLLCIITAVYSFFLSFSISCFISAFGSDGLLLAFSVIGIRCLVTLPCYFLLALPAMENSALLFRFFSERRRRVALTEHKQSLWVLICICGVLLTVGICADLLFTPVLIQWTLQRIFV